MADDLRLYRLRRVSRCCGGRVAHDKPPAEDFLGLICVECGEAVRRFDLENALGEIVYPPTREEIEQIPPRPALGPMEKWDDEEEPQTYRLILPWRRG